MIEKKFVVSIGLEVVYDGAELDYQTEEELFDTYEQARARAESIKIGDVMGEYDDGAECRVLYVDLDDEPQDILF